MIQVRYILFFILFIMAGQLQATIFPLNIFQPYDPNVYKPYRGKGVTFDFNVTPEFGVKTKGRSSCPQPCDPPETGNWVDVMRIWQGQQNALAMLKGFNPGSEIGSLAQQLNVDDDNGIRGHICFCGDLDVRANVSLAGRWYFLDDFVLGGYLPVTSLKLCSSFKDQTQMLTSDDFLTKQLLTDNLAANVKRLGNGLTIKGWEKTGIGDFSVILDWYKFFPQARPLLKGVRTKARIGLSFPTAEHADVNDIMPIPLGNDGALGFIFGAGLDLRFLPNLQAGVEVEFLHLFSEVSERRIKTDRAQTDLLLLAKADVLKKFGFTHHFNLYVELFKFVRGLSASVTYQFWKHEDDRVAVLGNNFSTEVANSAVSLEEWTMHNLIFKVSYDFDQETENAVCSPYLALFYKIGVNGKNALLANTVGFTATASF
jgi:hypothetical protein